MAAIVDGMALAGALLFTWSLFNRARHRSRGVGNSEHNHKGGKTDS
jgi:hypothetical protein